MNLKTQIVGSCDLCNGSGFNGLSQPCQCLLKFRTYNRMINGGFSLKTINFLESNYSLPQFDFGEEFINFFVANPEFVESNGLSLYICSKEKGRGKTTLAHYLIYNIVQKFSDLALYNSERSYAFIHIENLIEELKDEQDEIWKKTWLVIDDVGNENKSASWKKSFLISNFQRIMHYRRDNNLPTIITSNYVPSNLSTLYDGELDSLLEIRPDGGLGGVMFREVRVGGGEDLRLLNDFTAWPI